MKRRHSAGLAQLVERKALNLVVVGSSPLVGVFVGRGCLDLHAHVAAPPIPSLPPLHQAEPGRQASKVDACGGGGGQAV